MLKTSRMRLIATLIGVAGLLWVSFSFIVALPLARGAEFTVDAPQTILRLDLLVASAIVTACLSGLRVLETKIHRGAYAHSVGTFALLGVSVALAAGVESNGIVASMLKAVFIALALVVGGAFIARLLPMQRSPHMD